MVLYAVVNTIASLDDYRITNAKNVLENLCYSSRRVKVYFIIIFEFSCCIFSLVKRLQNDDFT